MPLKYQEIAYKSLAECYLKAKDDLSKIIDMTNLILDDQEKIDLFNCEISKLEHKKSLISPKWEKYNTPNIPNPGDLSYKIDSEKYPIYFLMEDEYPTGDSFMKMNHEIFNLLWHEDKIQRIMILTEKQLMHFMQWVGNTFFLKIPSGDLRLWEFAGFRIKVIRGKIECI